MLSYQHSYHAGNLADVHKHALLSCLLARMTAKDKPLVYMETHAGRGLYALDDPAALRTGEAQAGIVMAEAARWFAPDHPYAQVLSRTRERHGVMSYPGSPMVAALSLRPGDRMEMAELHPREHAALAEVMAPHGSRSHRRDGLEMALAITPPMPRRGVLLIDPSYEVKDDYLALPRLLEEVHRKWGVGVLALWYPVLESAHHRAMLGALAARDWPRLLHSEVRFGPARPGHRMQGSGMFIVNAPFGLQKEADRLAALFAGL
ncbi:MAG: 23S rRNA (adenine(2030)-N(6))-methyltransferase RlmJ [Rhodobacteraceae bacterium]|nr:23S rRNA (adenine(2030)-N(6))-methyltransferase RlmJ [Paracoccaceae bacterium]